MRGKDRQAEEAEADSGGGAGGGKAPRRHTTSHQDKEEDTEVLAVVRCSSSVDSIPSSASPKRSRSKSNERRKKEKSRRNGGGANARPDSAVDADEIVQPAGTGPRAERSPIARRASAKKASVDRRRPSRSAASASTSECSSAEEIPFRVEFVQSSGLDAFPAVQPRQYVCCRLRVFAIFTTPGEETEEMQVRISSAQFESFVPHNGIQFLLTTEEYGVLRLRVHLVVKKDDLVLMPSTISQDSSPDRKLKKRVEDHSLTVIENPLFGKSSTTVRRVSSETGVQTLAIPGAMPAPSRPLEIHSSSCSACSTHRPCPQSKYKDISVAPQEKGSDILCYLRVMAPPPSDCKGWMPFAPSAAGRAIASLPPAEAEDLHDKILAGIHEDAPESTPPGTYQVIASVSSSARLVGDSIMTRLTTAKWCLSPSLKVASDIPPFFDVPSAVQQLSRLLSAGATPPLRAAVQDLQERMLCSGTASGWLKVASDLDVELRSIVRQHQSGLDFKRLMRLKNAFGATVLHNASALGFPMLMSLLLEETERRVGRGIVSAGVNATDMNDRTPLHVAALVGNKECVVTLLSFRAATSKRDVNGIIPLSYARQSGNGCLVRLLRSWSQMKDTKWLVSSLSMEKEKLTQTLEETQGMLATERNTVRKMREKNEAKQVSSPAPLAKTMQNPLFGMNAKTVLRSSPSKGELKVVNGQAVYKSSPSPEKSAAKQEENDVFREGVVSAYGDAAAGKVGNGRHRGRQRAAARKVEHDLRVMLERERLTRDMANSRLQALLQKLRASPRHDQELANELQDIALILDGNGGSSSTPTSLRKSDGYEERLKAREEANTTPSKPRPPIGSKIVAKSDSSKDHFDAKAPKVSISRSKSEKLRKMDTDTIERDDETLATGIRRRTSLGDSITADDLKDVIARSSKKRSPRGDGKKEKRERKEERKEKEKKEKERKRQEKERKKDEKDKDRQREKDEKERAKERNDRAAEESATETTEGRDVHSEHLVKSAAQVDGSESETIATETESEHSPSHAQARVEGSSESSVASEILESPYRLSSSPKRPRKSRRGKKAEKAESPKSPRNAQHSGTPCRRPLNEESGTDLSPRAVARSLSENTALSVSDLQGSSPPASRERKTRKKLKIPKLGSVGQPKEIASVSMPTSPRRGTVGSTMEALANMPLARTKDFLKNSLSSPRTLRKKKKSIPTDAQPHEKVALCLDPRELRRSHSEPRLSSWEQRSVIVSKASAVVSTPMPARSLQGFRRSYSEMMKVKLTADRVKRDQTKHYVALENEYLHHSVRFPGPDTSNSTVVARELAINDYLNFSGAVGLVAFQGDSVSACAKSFVVDWLVDQNQDMHMLDTFLITYRRFLEPSEVLAAVVRKWEEIPPWSKKPDGHRQKRTLFVLRHWIDQYYHIDFARDVELTEQLYAFLEGPVARAGHQGTTAALMKAIAMSLEVIREQQAHADHTLQAFPTTISERVELLDLSPEDVARQLTLMEAELFQDVEPVWFMAPDKKQNKALVMRFNTVSRWVSTEIVLEPNPRKRASVVRQFIRIAAMCLELNNFNGLLEIVSGLNNAMVQRLKKTWRAIPSKLAAKFEELETLMDSRRNFGAYRKRLKEATPPLLPYFGIFLRDISFADIGNEDAIPHIAPIHARPSAGPAKKEEEAKKAKDKLVNFTKLYLLHEVASEMARCKMRCQYTIPVNHQIRNYLGNLIVLNDVALEQHSLLCEPRAFEL